MDGGPLGGCSTRDIPTPLFSENLLIGAAGCFSGYGVIVCVVGKPQGGRRWVGFRCCMGRACSAERSRGGVSFCLWVLGAGGRLLEKQRSCPSFSSPCLPLCADLAVCCGGVEAGSCLAYDMDGKVWE